MNDIIKWFYKKNKEKEIKLTNIIERGEIKYIFLGFS